MDFWLGSDGKLAQVSDDVVDTIDVDLSGKYVIPSLIDLHVHTTHDPLAHLSDSFTYSEDTALSVARGVRSLHDSLAAGVCLVRDLGSTTLAMRQLKPIAQDLLLPDIVSAGEPLCSIGGHGASFGRNIPSKAARRGVLEKHAASEHEWVKVMSGPEIVDLTTLTDLCQIGHDLGLKIALHAFSDEAVWNAIRAGVDTVEHCVVSSTDMAEAAGDTGVHFVPTAHAAISSLRPDYLRWSPDSENKYLYLWARYLEERRQAHLESGLPVYVGTDGGAAPCRTADIIDEIIELSSWGFEMTKLLIWASAGSAAILNRDREVGKLKIGYMANFIILEDDPVRIPEVLRMPAAVFFRGVPVIDRMGIAND